MTIEEQLRADYLHHTDPSVIAFRKQREKEEAQRRKDSELGHRRAAHARPKQGVHS
jgi:hypothetical protein